MLDQASLDDSKLPRVKQCPLVIRYFGIGGLRHSNSWFFWHGSVIEIDIEVCRWGASYRSGCNMRIGVDRVCRCVCLDWK